MKLLHPHTPLALLLLLPLASTAHAEPTGPWFAGARTGHPSPFRWTGQSSPAPRTVAQAEPASQPQAKQEAPPKAGTVTEGGQCDNDDACVVGTYCDNGSCVKIERPFNALYLFYRSGDGRFTEVLGIYWHQKGTKGYRVVFPFYWHFWSPKDRSTTVFPFYSVYEAPADGVRSTFYGLIQYRRTPREKNYRLWPIFFWTDYGERGAGLTILPLFHFAREGTRRAAIIPLFLSGFNRDPQTGYSQGLALGLYYWHYEGQKRAHALLPLFFHSRGEKDRFLWVLPFNFYWRTGDERTLMLLPLFYQSRSPERTTTLSLVPPLYHHRHGSSSRLYALPFFFHSRDADRTFFLAGPFYHRGWSGGRSWGLVPILFGGKTTLTSYTVLFPVFWRFTSRYHNFTLAGPVFYYRRGAKTTAGLPPLVLHHRDREKGSGLTTVVPLFYYGTAEHGRQANIVSPLFLYERDDEAKVTHWGLVVPPYYSRRDAEREVDTLFPLLLRWHDKVDQATTWVFGPVVTYWDPDGGTQVFFPFFWRFTDDKAGAATSILFPFGYRHRRPDGTHSNLFFPFYYRRDRDGWSFRLLPILYFGRSADRRHAVLFPVFWRFSRRDGPTTTVLGPLYYQGSPKGWHAGLVPLFYAGSEEGESYHVLFPAVWHLSSRKEGYSTFVAGPGFYSHGKHGRVGGLLPLFAAGNWKGTSFQTVLPPLFYRTNNPKEGKSLLVAGPYVGWRERGVRGHAVIPLAYYRRSDKKGTVAFTLPLFFYRDRGRDQLLATPLGGYRRERREGVFEGIVGPFVWHRGPTATGFAVLPFFYRWKRPADNATTTVIFPLGVHHRSDKERALVWFPLFWRYTDAKQRTLVIFPLYWRVRQRLAAKPADDDLNADVVFPLFWSLRQGKKSLHVIGPIFWARGPGSLQAAVVPLFLYRRDKDGATLYSLPFIYYNRDEKQQRRSWIVGLFYHRRYRQGSATGLIPLFFRKNTEDSRYTIIPPLYWDIGNPSAGTRTVFVGPFFYRRKAASKGVGLAPLIYAGWDPAGGRTAAVLPLFYYRGELGRRAFYCPIFGFDTSPIRSQWYVGTYFRHSSTTTTFDMAFPLFFRHSNHIAGRTTVFSLPGYYGRWSKETSFHLAFPFYWYHHRIDRTALVLFPFYWDFNNRYSTRTIVIFPALMYHRDHVAKTTSVLHPPGLWLRFGRTSTDGVLFPVVWHFGGKDRSSTVVFPLFWDFKRGPSRRYTLFIPVYWDFRYPKERYTVVFPLLYRHDTRSEHKLLVLNSWYHGYKRDNTYDFYLVPLFSVHRQRPGDFRLDILGRLFGYERVGRNRLLTLFFYTFPLEPLPAKTPPARQPQGPAQQRAGAGARPVSGKR